MGLVRSESGSCKLFLERVTMTVFKEEGDTISICFVPF
jgi:hypothetical protein